MKTIAAPLPDFYASAQPGKWLPIPYGFRQDAKLPWKFPPIPGSHVHGRFVYVFHRASDSNKRFGSARSKAVRLSNKLRAEKAIPESNQDLIVFFEQCRSPLNSKLLPKVLDLAEDERNDVTLVVSCVSRTAHTLKQGKRIIRLMKKSQLRIVKASLDFDAVCEWSWRQFRKQLQIHEREYLMTQSKAAAQRKRNPPPARQSSHFKRNGNTFQFQKSFAKYVVPIFEALAHIDRNANDTSHAIAAKVASWLNHEGYKPERASEYTADLVRKHLENPEWKRAFDAYCEQKVLAIPLHSKMPRNVPRKSARYERF